MSTVEVTGDDLTDGAAADGDGPPGVIELSATQPSATITVCPDGPLLVRGRVRIVDSSGAVVPQNRPTIALCRCAKSRIAPLCDGTHRLLRSHEGAPKGARD